MNSEQASQGAPSAGVGPTSQGLGKLVGDDLLRLITEAERQLTQLKQSHAEHERERKTLDELAAGLAQREGELSQLATEAKEAREAAETRLSQIRALGAEMEQGRGELAAKWEEFNAARARSEGEVARREQEIQARGATLDEREQRLAAQAAALSRHRESVDAMAAELVKRDEALAARSEEVRRAEERRAEVASRLEAVERALADKAAEAQTAWEQASGAAARAAAGEKLAAERSAELERVRAQAIQSEKDRAQAVQGAQESQKRCLAALRRVGELEEGARAAQRAGEESARKAAAELESVRKEQRALAEQVRAREAELARLKAESARAAEEAGRLRDAGARQQRELVEARARADVEGAHAERDGRTAEAHAAREELAKVRAQAKAGLEERERLVAALRAARTETEEARALAASRPAHAEPDPAVVEAIDRRRDRLRLLRMLLQAQSERIENAGRALRERYEECERVLAQKGEIAAARTALGAARQRLARAQAKAAKGRAAGLVLCAVLILGVLGAMSWTVAGRIAPAIYAARAVIQADESNGAASEAQLAEWQRFHQALLMDPQAMQGVAERMGRRGIASLATPGSLLERLRVDLDAQSARDGELVVEWRGAGAATTARELDTYLTAIVSQANAARDHRADGLATVIAQAASVGDGPIHDERPVYAAGVLGAGSLLSLLAGLGLWRRLVSVRTRFEAEARLDDLVDEANWGQVGAGPARKPAQP